MKPGLVCDHLIANLGQKPRCFQLRLQTGGKSMGQD
jgi:hypothetical protein